LAKEWVTIDREFQTWLRGLKPRLDDWRANKTDDGTLLRGGPLALAERWTAEREEDLNEDEKKFVAESTKLRQDEQKRIKDDLEREQERITSTVAKRATGALDELRSHLMYSLGIVFMIMAIVQLCTDNVMLVINLKNI
jgi:hypothetical protein